MQRGLQFCATVGVLWCISTAYGQEPPKIPSPDKPAQFTEPQLATLLVEASSFIRAPQARSMFNVDGAGLTAAVIDTGLRTTHIDFKDRVTGASRVAAQHNFTQDNQGNPGDASDLHGHGTNVGGIIVANGLHIGIAPGARIVPLKVLPNSGSGDLSWTRDALGWVLENRVTHGITVVNVSLGTPSNYTTEPNMAAVYGEIRSKIQELRAVRIPVVIAAGNDFFIHNSSQGMSFPGIIRESISVGALYDSNLPGSYSYSSGAVAFKIKEGFLTPFSQRLHESISPTNRTDIFAPGAPITSTGIANDNGESIQHGTSQASPVTAGVVLLVQQYYRRVTGQLPTVDQLEDWLRSGGFRTLDSDPGNVIDNVTNTDLEFLRLDALDTLRSAQQSITQSLLSPTGSALRGEKK